MPIFDRYSVPPQGEQLMLLGKMLSDMPDTPRVDFDHASCEIVTHMSFPDSVKQATVSLETPALLGFGAMMGVGSHLEELFPHGTEMALKAWRNGSTMIRIGNEEGSSTAVRSFVYSENAATHGDLLVVARHMEPATGSPQALQAIQNPQVLLAAASYTHRLSERATHS